MIQELEKLQEIIANVLHKLLAFGGSAFEIANKNKAKYSYCRMEGSNFESDAPSCGNFRSSFPNLSDLGEYSDLLIQVHASIVIAHIL